MNLISKDRKKLTRIYSHFLVKKKKGEKNLVKNPGKKICAIHVKAFEVVLQKS